MTGPHRALVLLASASALLAARSTPPTTEGDAFAERVAPVLAAHCASCHEPEELAGELDLTRFRTERDALAAPEVWPEVARMLRRGKMPPKVAETRPDDAETAAVLAWIESVSDASALADLEEAHGRTTARRLNRFELRNAVLDLFGVDAPMLDALPADGVSHGFDVVGETLSLPPLVFEKTFEAAEAIAFEALPSQQLYDEQTRPAAELAIEGGARLREVQGVIGMYSNATATGTFDVPRTGEYVVRVLAAAQQAGPDLARVAIGVDGRELERVDVSAGVDRAEHYEVRAQLERGARRISASFVNDYYAPEDPDPQNRDRNLYVVNLTLVGPTDAPLRTPFEARFAPDGELRDGKRGARKVVRRVARLVWRGRVTNDQVSDLLELAPRGADATDHVRTALVAMLVSPRFLYRLEPDERDATRALDGDELATRLAACLWSSVPDEALLDAAERDDLADDAGFACEVDRMLRDARSSRLSHSFAGQWLQLRRLDVASPDPRRFPAWDDALAQSMRRESEAFFEAVLREERPLEELLAADFTFVDERLARHYGIAGVEGPELRRVSIPAHLRGVRGGILGQGAPLVATSMPTRTSPVVRGRWVLEALLASPPPPPPPGVDSIDEEIQNGRAASVREQLELHRSKRACAVCHEPMDGLGFALENYGPTGAWREVEDGVPIDTRAELPGGIRFEGPSGLRERLLTDGSFRRGLARHFATFALGRGLTDADLDALDALADDLPAGATLHDLIHAVLGHELFRTHRRGAPQ